MAPSTIDAPNRWESSIAGMAAPRPYGLYSGTPLASVKRSGWMPSSMPTMSADAVIPT